MEARTAQIRLRLAIRLLVAALLAAAVSTAGPGLPAAAKGGWASGTLDSTPDATAGATSQVGFTILQHGITPADGLDDVGIVIRLGDGSTEFFPATGDKRPGHYVAEVTFPDVGGEYAWSIRMDWFGEQELDTLRVAPAAGGGASAGSSIPWVLGAGALVLATIVLAQLALTRRRRGSVELRVSQV